MPDSLADRTLTLDLVLGIPRRDVWRGWTEPDLLVRWFTPAPWRTTRAEVDLRPGGRSLIVMEGPDGEVVPNAGVYLEVVPETRLVFTDAFVRSWEPSEAAFMVGTIALSDHAGGGTVYRATVQHWSVESCDRHRAMGFVDGWTAAARQLEALFAGG